MNGRHIDIDTRIRGPTVFLSLFTKCFQPEAPGMPQDSSMLNNRVKCSESLSLWFHSFVYLESLAILPAASQTQTQDGRCREGHTVGKARGGEGGGRERTSWCVFFSSDHKDRFTAIWKESIAAEPFIS